MAVARSESVLPGGIGGGMPSLTGADIWKKALQETASSTAENEAATILCFADPECPIGGYLQSLQMCYDENITEVEKYQTDRGQAGLVDFASILIRDTSSRMSHGASEGLAASDAGVWILRDATRMKLFKQLVRTHWRRVDCRRSMVVIVCDLSNPWKCISSTRQWIDTISDWTAQMVNQKDETSGDQASSAQADDDDDDDLLLVAPEKKVGSGHRGGGDTRTVSDSFPGVGSALQQMRTKNADYLTGKHTSKTTTANPSAELETDELIEQSSSESLASEAGGGGTEVDFVNLGFPLVIVCCNADIQKQDPTFHEEVNVAVAHLCRMARQYGAALIVADQGSETQQSRNIDTLYTYIGHRLNGYPLKASLRLNPLDSMFVPPLSLSEHQLEAMIAKTIAKSFNVPVETILTDRSMALPKKAAGSGAALQSAPTLDSFLQQLLSKNPNYLHSDGLDETVQPAGSTQGSPTIARSVEPPPTSTRKEAAAKPKGDAAKTRVSSPPSDDKLKKAESGKEKPAARRTSTKAPAAAKSGGDAPLTSFLADLVKKPKEEE